MTTWTHVTETAPLEGRGWRCLTCIVSGDPVRERDLSAHLAATAEVIDPTSFRAHSQPELDEGLRWWAAGVLTPTGHRRHLPAWDRPFDRGGVPTRCGRVVHWLRTGSHRLEFGRRYLERPVCASCWGADRGESPTMVERMAARMALPEGPR